MSYKSVQTNAFVDVSDGFSEISGHFRIKPILFPPTASIWYISPTPCMQISHTMSREKPTPSPFPLSLSLSVSHTQCERKFGWLRTTSPIQSAGLLVTQCSQFSDPSLPSSFPPSLSLEWLLSSHSLNSQEKDFHKFIIRSSPSSTIVVLQILLIKKKDVWNFLVYLWICQRRTPR